MLNDSYNRWLWGSCCCESNTTPIGDCGDKEQCSCENILLEISNLHTTDNVISGEVDNKQDKLSAGTGIEITEDNVINCTANPDLSDYYTKEEVDELISDVPSLSGYATEQWVENQGYLTEHQSLSGYATEQWVEDNHYITGVDLSNYATLQDIPTVPTNVSAFNNDAHYVTSAETANYVTSGNVETQINNHFYCCSEAEWATISGNTQPNILYLVY